MLSPLYFIKCIRSEVTECCQFILLIFVLIRVRYNFVRCRFCSSSGCAFAVGYSIRSADTGTGFAPTEPNMVEAPRTNPRNAERVFFLIFFSFLLDVTDRNQCFLIPVCFNYLFLSFKSGTFLILSFTFYNNSSCNRRCCQGK